MCVYLFVYFSVLRTHDLRRVCFFASIRNPQWVRWWFSHWYFETSWRSEVSLQPYRAGRCDTVLKWKPPSHNSIDFKLQIRKVCREGELPEHIGFLYVQHESRPMGEMKATKKLLPYDNKIIECTLQVSCSLAVDWICRMTSNRAVIISRC